MTRPYSEPCNICEKISVYNTKCRCGFHVCVKHKFPEKHDCFLNFENGPIFQNDDSPYRFLTICTYVLVYTSLNDIIIYRFDVNTSEVKPLERVLINCLGPIVIVQNL